MITLGKIQTPTVHKAQKTVVKKGKNEKQLRGVLTLLFCQLKEHFMLDQQLFIVLFFHSFKTSAMSPPVPAFLELLVGLLEATHSGSRRPRGTRQFKGNISNNDYICKSFMKETAYLFFMKNRLSTSEPAPRKLLQIWGREIKGTRPIEIVLSSHSVGHDGTAECSGRSPDSALGGSEWVLAKPGCLGGWVFS